MSDVAAPPKVGFVSLGCPKALTDSELILTQLSAEGYATSKSYAGADLVIVNTCGFIDDAVKESLDAIGEALAENGKVIVTGCLGAKAGASSDNMVREVHPSVLAVTGPHQYEAVLDAVHAAVPPKPDPFLDLLPPAAVHLTPRHYSYLKISEGCSHKCRFCIIPDMRGLRPALETVFNARPDILNHNVETVPRLYRRVRPQADYRRSLDVLRAAKVEHALRVKSGIMVGLGETRDEVLSLMDDFAANGVDVMTIGQYLQPTRMHLPVEEFVHPDVFAWYKQEGEARGIEHVESGPLVRSSYHAERHVA